ncbi:GlcNAc transferase [Capsaspora owczarzaki ATCC 30864]|uniref:GlcNAc transferase n=1 Tax=Capsaspora owczarzaki (strain ATCC 30864) TaxID=595528 RepID=A0A0D2VVB5_CAPO3|nr:GlcNAc transferase [Capsaspora owczarzaki ATCC 30864]KJE95407.1 GlcNAc transferase [Capsaspora owczarzaki ATCC 30864]|eukprot:XP_004345451.2 GlcNAc transferase [Capsaspora owczarzaki ATCC 30864]
MNSKPQSRHHRICMVSDFFYPNTGGVENHIYQLSQCLIRRGHKVVVITHAYDGIEPKHQHPSSESESESVPQQQDASSSPTESAAAATTQAKTSQPAGSIAGTPRVGVRVLSMGLKVYYLPNIVFYNQCTLPTLFTNLPLMRNIFVRERISIVHGHAAFSTLCHDAILHARTMGIPAVFTDHSLFGFADASSILTNKFLKFSLSDVSHAICVSHTSRENTVLRSAIEPERVSVIPNAVDASLFVPDTSQRDPAWITIVVVCRLVYRKGMDLLAAIIPRVCAAHPNVRFLIGGDGPKRLLLEEVRERHKLHERMSLIGHVPHNGVRAVLNRGDIFLNTSLTEAFCIAIVEAASCGLSVVSTRVGGVPEVFPEDMMVLAEPTVDDLVRAVCEAIPRINDINPDQLHQRVKSMYNWNDVAARTEVVYDNISGVEESPLVERLHQYYGCGPVSGKLFVMFVLINTLFYYFLEWLCPRAGIDICPDFDTARYTKLVRQERDRGLSQRRNLDIV